MPELRLNGIDNMEPHDDGAIPPAQSIEAIRDTVRQAVERARGVLERTELMILLAPLLREEESTKPTENSCNLGSTSAGNDPPSRSRQE